MGDRYYGIRPTTGAFSITTNTDRSESVMLVDGSIVTVISEQEAIAAAHSDFNPHVLSTDPTLPSVNVRKEAVDQANRLYAVLGVLKAGPQLDGRLVAADSFQHALRHLCDGGDIDSTDFPKVIPNVYGSAVHVVFVINNASGPYGQSLYAEHGSLAPIQTYDYSNGRHGYRWRYALQSASGAEPSSTIVRQCERTVGSRDACPDFNI